MKMTRLSVALSLAALLVVPNTLNGRQCILKNGSMEFGEGAGAIDPQVPAFWTEVGVNIERSATVNLAPPGPGHALKAFGDGDSTSVSANQEVTNIAPGQSVTASVFLYSPGNDKLGGSGEAGLVLEFLNQFGGTITLYQIYPFNASSPADTWVPAVLGPYAAPSGTTKVRVTCRLKWSLGNVFGAAYWDDAWLTVNGGPNLLLNGDFETAGHSAGQSPMGIDDWTGFNDQEKSADFAWNGDFSLKVGVDHAYSGLWQNMAVLSAGDRLYLKAWCWIPSAEPLTANSRAGLKLEFAPNGEQPPPVENLAFDENVDPNVWTLVPLSAPVPTDATIARIVCIFAGDAYTTGNVYFDSAWAERNSQPGVNKLLNASFESGPGGQNGIDNWTEFGTTEATTRKSCFSIPAHQGSCVAKSTGPSVTGIWQEIPVVAGETLTTRVYVCTRNTAPLTGPGRAGIKIEWVLGSVPPPVDIGGPTNTLDATDPNDVWLPLYIDYTMPAGSNAITRYVDIVERGTALTGRIYFDACEAVVLNKFDGADADGDDDEDLLDFAYMQRAFSGSGGGLEWMGMVFDSDNDQDVDMTDFNYFAPRMTGPGQ